MIFTLAALAAPALNLERDVLLAPPVAFERASLRQDDAAGLSVSLVRQADGGVWRFEERDGRWRRAPGGEASPDDLPIDLVGTHMAVGDGPRGPVTAAVHVQQAQGVETIRLTLDDGVRAHEHPLEASQRVSGLIDVRADGERCETPCTNIERRYTVLGRPLAVDGGVSVVLRAHTVTSRIRCQQVGMNPMPVGRHRTPASLMWACDRTGALEVEQSDAVVWFGDDGPIEARPLPFEGTWIDGFADEQGRLHGLVHGEAGVRYVRLGPDAGPTATLAWTPPGEVELTRARVDAALFASLGARHGPPVGFRDGVWTMGGDDGLGAVWIPIQTGRERIELEIDGGPTNGRACETPSLHLRPNPGFASMSLALREPEEPIRGVVNWRRGPHAIALTLHGERARVEVNGLLEAEWVVPPDARWVFLGYSGGCAPQDAYAARITRLAVTDPLVGDATVPAKDAPKQRVKRR